MRGNNFYVQCFNDLVVRTPARLKRNGPGDKPTLKTKKILRYSIQQVSDLTVSLGVTILGATADFAYFFRLD